ncbi:unnamed protein product, partial [Darwinula stevensoni]
MRRLNDLPMDGCLVRVLQSQAQYLLESGPSSGLGLGVHPESIPMHTFAKYLFAALLPHDPDLAYSIGLRAMRLPILEEHDESEEGSRHGNHGGGGGGGGGGLGMVLGRYPRWFTLGHLETQQGALASDMLNAAKNDVLRLRTVLDAAQRHVHSASHLFRLAQDAFRCAVQTDTPRCPMLLN